MLSKLRATLRGLSFPSWWIPIALLVLTLLSYGLRALNLGFYWDDWPYVWFFHRFGPAGLVNAFEGDRPFLSFIYVVSFSLFGDSSQAWQLFAIFARWLCSAGLWWAFSLTWPRYKNKAAWAVMLFTVYPGFTQQWIAVIYGQAFFLFAALFFSLGLSLWLVRNRQRVSRVWIVAGTLLALALSYFNMFSTEYFFGLELLRPVLIWLVILDQQNSLSEPAALKRRLLFQQMRRVLLWWAPYLALMVVFIAWRLWIHPFTGHPLTTVQSMEVSPLSSLWTLALAIIQDFVVASVAAWGQAMTYLAGFIENGPANGLRLLALIILTGILSFIYLLGTQSKPSPEEAAPVTSRAFILTSVDRIPPRPPLAWGWQAIIVGLFAFLVSGWPVWLTGLHMRMGFPWDRYSLALAVGTTLMLAGLVDVLCGQSHSRSNMARKASAISLILALAVGFQNNTALQYKQDWNLVEDFYWQISWRAPSVLPNTLFASDSMPFQFYEDDSLSAPLNWTYDPNGKSAQMPYILYDLSTRRYSMPALEPGLPVQHAFRSAFFNGTTDQVLAFSYNPPGCVHILDPRYDAELYNLPNWLVRIRPLSNPVKLIKDTTQPVTPPTEIFGSEPKHRWCYYFEKAELARQTGDWQAVIKLSEASIGSGYRPDDPYEYLPFIEALNHVGLYDDAIQLTETTYHASAALQPALCATWKRSYQPSSDSNGKHRPVVEKLLSCSVQ